MARRTRNDDVAEKIQSIQIRFEKEIWTAKYPTFDVWLGHLDSAIRSTSNELFDVFDLSLWDSPAALHAYEERQDDFSCVAKQIIQSRGLWADWMQEKDRDNTPP